MSEEALTGLVLAGGASRRMGTDKALLRVGGEPLAARVVRRLRPLCDEILVASGDGMRLPGFGDRQVADAVDNGGPLAGIVAGLEAAPTSLVAVAAVDMPWVNPAVYALLARRWHGEPAVVAHAGGRLQPLHAVYARVAAPQLRGLLLGGERSVQAALVGAGAAVVGEDAWRAVDPTGRFADNLNRPGDVAPLFGPPARPGPGRAGAQGPR